MRDIIKLLKESMAMFSLSAEKAAPFIGCSGQQVRRWISGTSKPGPLHLQAIERGIKRMDLELGAPAEKGQAWRGGLESKPSKEDLKLQEEVQIFFKLLVARSSRIEQDMLFSDPSAFVDFQNFLWIARKYNVKLPKI